MCNRVTLEAYIVSIKGLARSLLKQMAKALEMDEGEMVELFSDG